MLLILGHLLKTRWPPSNFLECILLTHLVNAIPLELFHHSISNLISDVILPFAISKMAAIKILKRMLSFILCSKENKWY